MGLSARQEAGVFGPCRDQGRGWCRTTRPLGREGSEVARWQCARRACVRMCGGWGGGISTRRRVAGSGGGGGWVGVGVGSGSVCKSSLASSASYEEGRADEQEEMRPKRFCRLRPKTGGRVLRACLFLHDVCATGGETYRGAGAGVSTTTTTTKHTRCPLLVRLCAATHRLVARQKRGALRVAARPTDGPRGTGRGGGVRVGSQLMVWVAWRTRASGGVGKRGLLANRPPECLVGE